MLRELAAIGGIVSAVINDLNKERAMLGAHQRWRLKPLLRFPPGVYDLLKPHIPTVFFKQERAIPTLLRALLHVPWGG